MAGIIVDDRPYQVDERENLLQACLSLGFNLPYFCWHPALGSVGPVGNARSSNSGMNTTAKGTWSWPA